MQKQILSLIFLKKQILFFKEIILSIGLSAKIISFVVWKKWHKKNTVVVALYEHIGDIVACEPVVPYLKNEMGYSYVIFVTNKSNSILFKHHPLVDKIYGIKYFSNWIIIRKIFSLIKFPKKQIVDLHIGPKRCSVFKIYLQKENFGINRSNYLEGRNLVQAFSLAAGLSMVNGSPKFYHLKNKVFKTEKPYIILHTKTNSEIKDWLPEKWTHLTKKLINEGYCIIEIGTVKAIESNDFSNYKDFTGKQALLDIASLIKNSFFFIGLDSGFAHFANSLNKNGIVLIGRYIIEGYSFVNYNPFSGKYNNPIHIVSPFGSQNTIDIKVEDVLERFYFLTKDNRHAQNNVEKTN